MTTQAVVTPSDQPVARGHYRISTRVRKGCEALVSGEARTITDAAKLANISREEFSRALSKPHVAEYLKVKACRALAIDAARAAAVKSELLHSDSDHVRNDVSTYLLALAGIRPANTPQVSVNIDIKAGYVIDLTDASGMSHTHTIEAKALGDNDKPDDSV